jgi:DNA-binding CsgD family transcriptional regulator
MRLTKREIEVQYWICKGYSTRQIAAELKISHRTAEDHRAHLLKKHGVHNAVQLVRENLRNPNPHAVARAADRLGIPPSDIMRLVGTWQIMCEEVLG